MVQKQNLFCIYLCIREASYQYRPTHRRPCVLSIIIVDGQLVAYHRSINGRQSETETLSPSPSKRESDRGDPICPPARPPLLKNDIHQTGKAQPLQNLHNTSRFSINSLRLLETNTSFKMCNNRSCNCFVSIPTPPPCLPLHA